MAKFQRSGSCGMLHESIAALFAYSSESGAMTNPDRFAIIDWRIKAAAVTSGSQRGHT